MRAAPGIARPRAVVIAAVAVGIEGAGAVAAAAGFLVAALVGTPADRGVAATLVALLLVLGAGLLLDARGLWRLRPAASTPAYVAQFFALVVAWYQRHTLPVVTGAIVVVALVVVAALSARESREALQRR